MRWYRHLQKELRMEGASKVEALELADIARDLRVLARSTQSPKHDVPLRKWGIPAAYVSAGVIIGAIFVSLSQAAPPDSTLYPVQKATDNVAILIDPSYRASVMMERSAQVHELVLTHANQSQIMAVLANYTHVAQHYKVSSPSNYAAFEYCETNLKAAAVHSTPPVREAILKSLASLSDI